MFSCFVSVKIGFILCLGELALKAFDGFLGFVELFLTISPGAAVRFFKEIFGIL